MKQLRTDIALCLLIFAAALAMRIVVAAPVFAGDTRMIAGDDGDYYTIAISLITQGTFSLPTGPTAYRMPFFPLFLAFWHLLLGPQPYAALPVLLAVGALIPVGTYVLGRALANRAVGLLAGLLLAFDYELAFFSRLYMTETIFAALVLAGMLAAWRLRVTMSWRWAATAGVALGCACLTRANFLPFVALLLLWLVWAGWERRRLAFRNATIVGAIVVALWLPWVARNYLVFHRLIPFTTQGGAAYYGLYNDISTSGHPDIPYGFWVWRIVDPPDEPGKVWDEAALDEYQRELARDWIVAHPAEAIKVSLAQAAYFWSAEERGSYYRVVPIGLITLLVVAALRRQPDTILWLVLALAMTGLAVISVGQNRYAYPLRPILAVMTAIALGEAARALATMRGRAAALRRSP